MEIQSLMAALEPMIIIVLAIEVRGLIAPCMAPMVSMYQVVGHDAYTGENHYVPISDLNTFLTELRNSEGTEIAIDVAAYRTVPVNTVIEIFDQCQIQGFTRTRVR